MHLNATQLFNITLFLEKLDQIPLICLVFNQTILEIRIIIPEYIGGTTKV